MSDQEWVSMRFSAKTTVFIYAIYMIQQVDESEVKLQEMSKRSSICRWDSQGLRDNEKTNTQRDND